MAEIRIEHRFSCSQETFWAQVFFDPEYNRRLFLEEVGCPRYRLIELEETEQEIVRVQEITPRVAGVPAPIQALVGEGLSYLERDVFTRATRRMQISVTPNRLSSKLDIGGLFYTQPEGERRCRRVFEFRVVCRLLGLGGLLERQILNDTRRDYDLAAAFTERYLVEQRLT